MSVATEPATTPVPAAPAPRRRSKGRVIAMVVAGLLALAAIVVAGAVVFVNESTKDAQQVADRFVRAVDRGDGAAAYALAAPAFREVTTEAQLTGLVDQLAPLADGGAKVTGKSINAGTDSGKIAVLVYGLRATGGGSLSFKVQLREEDDRWQVMNFRSSRSSLSTDVE